MKNKLYHLSTCSTCSRIISETGAAEKLELCDIRSKPLTPAQLDALYKLAGSYEALFNRRAIKYKELGLKDMKLTEDDYRRLILEEYTFLKRPVAVVRGRIFIGNDKKTVAALAEKLR